MLETRGKLNTGLYRQKEKKKKKRKTEPIQGSSVRVYETCGGARTPRSVMYVRPAAPPADARTLPTLPSSGHHAMRVACMISARARPAGQQRRARTQAPCTHTFPMPRGRAAAHGHGLSIGFSARRAVPWRSYCGGTKEYCCCWRLKRRGGQEAHTTKMPTCTVHEVD